MAKNKSIFTPAAGKKLARVLTLGDLSTLAHAANEVSQEEFNRLEREIAKKYGFEVA